MPRRPVSCVGTPAVGLHGCVQRVCLAHGVQISGRLCGLSNNHGWGRLYSLELLFGPAVMAGALAYRTGACQEERAPVSGSCIQLPAGSK